MNLIRLLVEECAVVIIAACVAIGGFVEVRNLPLHEHNYIQIAYHQYAISLGFGLFLGGVIVSMLLERRTNKILLIDVLLLLLATSPPLWAIYAWKVAYWQVYIPSCIICTFAGVALSRAARFHLMLQSLDRRVIILLAWICTLGIAGLFINNTFRQDIKKLHISMLIKALIPICLGVLGFWGAIHVDRLLFHLGENPPIGLPSLFEAILYLVSVLVIRQRGLTNVIE